MQVYSIYLYFGRTGVQISAAVLIGDCYAIEPLSCLSSLSVCDVGVLWTNGWTGQDEIWHGGRPPPRPFCVRWGPSSPEIGHSPQFSAHVRCGQTAGWINMLLGRRQASARAQATLFRWRAAPTPQKGAQQPPDTVLSANVY